MEYLEGRFVYGDDIYVDEYYSDERWSHIDGFPGYFVSDKGRIWSERHQQFLVLKQLDNHGHLGVCLYVDGERYYRYLHRLVAEAFIPNPDGLPVVRHICDEPSRNEAEDLSWGTQRDNWNDAIRNGRGYALTPEDRERGYEQSRTPVVAIDLTTGQRRSFRGQRYASKALGIPQANIWKVLTGERRQAGGYRFEYSERRVVNGHH